MAVAHQIGQIFLAGLPVNHIDDDCPHDRTSLLTAVLVSGRLRHPKKLVSSVHQNRFVRPAGDDQRNRDGWRLMIGG
jgi:hypothetical protein